MPGIEVQLCAVSCYLEATMGEVKGVEVLSEDYSLTEHRQLEQQGGVQCIAFTDGDSLKARA